MITLTIKHKFDNDMFHNDDRCYKGENLTSIGNMDVWGFYGNIFEENHLRAPHRNNDKIFQLNDYMQMSVPELNLVVTGDNACDVCGELIKSNVVSFNTEHNEDKNFEYLYKFDVHKNSDKLQEPEALYAHLMINYDGGYSLRFYDTASTRNDRTIHSKCAYFDIRFLFIEDPKKAEKMNKNEY